MCADMGNVFGSGVIKAPIKKFAPKNNKLIVDPCHIADWFDIDTNPHFTNVTGLICGVGLDLKSDYDKHYNKESLNKIFYIHPANIGDKTSMLHNHAVMFSPLTFPENDINLTKNINHIVDNGDFIDMKHILDTTTIKKALIGICYIDDINV